MVDLHGQLDWKSPRMHVAMSVRAFPESLNWGCRIRMTPYFCNLFQISCILLYMVAISICEAEGIVKSDIFGCQVDTEWIHSEKIWWKIRCRCWETERVLGTSVGGNINVGLEVGLVGLRRGITPHFESLMKGKGLGCLVQLWDTLEDFEQRWKNHLIFLWGILFWWQCLEEIRQR